MLLNAFAHQRLLYKLPHGEVNVSNATALSSLLHKKNKIFFGSFDPIIYLVSSDVSSIAAWFLSNSDFYRAEEAPVLKGCSLVRSYP